MRLQACRSVTTRSKQATNSNLTTLRREDSPQYFTMMSLLLMVQESCKTTAGQGVHIYMK